MMTLAARSTRVTARKLEKSRRPDLQKTLRMSNEGFLSQRSLNSQTLQTQMSQSAIGAENVEDKAIVGTVAGIIAHKGKGCH